MRKLLVVVLALIALVPAGARPEARATTKEAEAMVHQAVGFMKKHGREKALATFSDPKGAFTYRDLYVMVYDLDGVCLAHGANKAKIGKNLAEDRAPDGTLYVKDRIRIAKERGKGWQEYKYLNPATGQIEQKVAYLELVDGVMIASGAYKP
jgi:cytochrome c